MDISYAFHLIKQLIVKKGEVRHNDALETISSAQFNKEEIIKEYNERKMITNYPVGSRVILKSNENESYKIGNIVRYDRITKSEKLIPVVTVDGENNEFYCFSIIRHYSKTLTDILDKLSPREQWNVLSEFYTIESN
jgi:hypothetical protein